MIHQGVSPYHILAVTFTNKSAREMKSRVEKVLEHDVNGMWLGTFHGICARILRREAAHEVFTLDYLKRYQDNDKQVPLFPFTSYFSIYDQADQISLVKRIMHELKIDYKLFKPSNILNKISSYKNELIQPEGIQPEDSFEKVVVTVYKRYQTLLNEFNSLDFDDLLLWVYHLLKDNREKDSQEDKKDKENKQTVRGKYPKLFECILVDEFQDTNKVQYELLQLLAKDHNDIFVVGDEDQSIYGWRGADYHNISNFENDYPKVATILLLQNYRSVQNVLDAAGAVIDKNGNRTAKHLQSAREETGEKLILYESEDEFSEVAFITDTIQRLVKLRRYSMGDFAVMYRTNAQSRILEEGFRKAGVLYHIVGTSFYDRREVKDIISYLRLVQNPSDQIALERIINVPPRGIGEKSLLVLNGAAKEIELSLSEAIFSLGTLGNESPFWNILGTRAAKSVAEFGAQWVKWRGEMDDLPLSELFHQILEDTGYEAYIVKDSEDGEDRLENVKDLYNSTFKYNETGGLTAFLEEAALMTDQDTLPEDAEVPILLTLHSAKGLEFPVVFIAGLEDGILPHSRAINSLTINNQQEKKKKEEGGSGNQRGSGRAGDIPISTTTTLIPKEPGEEMAEERRLFYVGITRAKDRVYLVRAERRNRYGNFEDTIASRFLADIPEKLLREEGLRTGDKNRARKDRQERWEGSDRRQQRKDEEAVQRAYGRIGVQSLPPVPGPSKPVPQPVTQSQFRAGMHVKHPLWDDGLVMESRLLSDGDVRLVIHFKSVGLKTLMASLANLVILD